MQIAIGNPAITLTQVGEDFDETEASTQWVINAYAISAVSLPFVPSITLQA